MTIPTYPDTITLTLDEVITICKLYDRYWGDYPESKFEGWAVVRDIIHVTTGDDLPEKAPHEWPWDGLQP